jgi:hypothetical protein
MSLAIQTKIEDTATPWLAELRGRITPHRIAAEVGPRLTRLVQRNFRKQGTNALGWPSTHFWGRAAEATNWQEGFGFVMISVNQIGIRQRLQGGDIKPVNAGALTIPAHPDAYGKRAREFSNLKFKFVLDPLSGRMRPALVANRATSSNIEFVTVKSGKNKGQTRASQNFDLQPLFWLAKKVHQNPNPAVLPSDAEFEAALDQSVDAVLRTSTGGEQ